jgi:hypothetical protein
MSMEWIRKTYNVPARRGGRIRFTDAHGGRWEGHITAASGPHLLVRMDGWRPKRRRARLHPTWNVEYLDQGGCPMNTKKEDEK